jgi:organic hydroperoxide reductase OsmC/OhrA
VNVRRSAHGLGASGNAAHGFLAARELMLRADQRCPYSNATRRNIIVALSVNGQPVSQLE